MIPMMNIINGFLAIFSDLDNGIVFKRNRQHYNQSKTVTNHSPYKNSKFNVLPVYTLRYLHL